MFKGKSVTNSNVSSHSFLLSVIITFTLGFILVTLIISYTLCAQEIIYKKNIVNDIVSYFPNIECTISEVKGESVVINLGKNAQIKSGIELLCIRDGDEFSHPITGEVLGRFEDKLCIIKIVDVFEDYSIGTVLERFSEQKIKAGDKLRISAAKIPTAIISDLDEDTNFLLSEEGLKKTGRFSFVSEKDLDSAMHELGISRPEDLSPPEIKGLGKKLDISVIIIPKILNFQERKVAQIQILSAKTGMKITQLSYAWQPELIASIQSMESSFSEPSKSDILNKSQAQKGKKFITTPAEGIYNSENLSNTLDVETLFIRIGDINGDGKGELCVTDGRNIYIYAVNGTSLKQMYQRKGSRKEQHISFDVADINKNGKEEIFVSNLENDYLYSFVLEWNGGKLQKIWDNIPFYISIMSIYPNDKVLIGQNMGISEPFDNHIFKYEWKNTSYSKGEEIYLPPNLNIFNLAMADIDADGEMETIHLSDKLRIFRGENLIWQSEAEYSGKSEFFEFKPKGAILTEEENIRIYLSSHIGIQDLNSNQRPEILLIKNPSPIKILFPRSPFYKKGEACLIEWNGIAFSEVWCSGKIEAYLTDITIYDLNLDGHDELVLSFELLEGLGKFWKKHKSRIFIY